jgi:hypothetical protein
MKLIIEFEQTKITLSVGSEGVTIDAPDPVEQETRQTTLSEAQWAAYAQGREDEREEHECEMCGFRKNQDWIDKPIQHGIGEHTREDMIRSGIAQEIVDASTVPQVLAFEGMSEVPRFKDLIALEAEYAEHHTDTEGRSLGDILGEKNLPPKVDPVTGDIAGWVKTYRTERRKRAIEAQPRAVCVSTCCGTEGARTRDGSCWGCR